jgi:hypothetical protein
MISQIELKNIIEYNKETGVFTRKISTSNGANAGDVAGTIHSSGYKKIRVLGVKHPVSAHRLAWLYVYGELPNHIDHINGIRSDNRIKNLRSVTQQENNLNKKIFKNNSSRVSGLSWLKTTGKWRVRIGVSGKYKSIGCFRYKWDAICARKSAENKYGYHLNHATRIN